MSFILESIKQAERQRKLSQQAPSISIEYSGEDLDDIEDNRKKWMLFGLALFITAMVVWFATNHFVSKDRQYIEELALSDTSNSTKDINPTIANEFEVDAKLDIAMVPVKNSVHQSRLKSEKVISENEEAPKTKVKEVKKTIKPVVSKTILATIYSDLAELAKEEALQSESNINTSQQTEQQVLEENIQLRQFDDGLVQIETANYVAPAVNSKQVARVDVEPEIKPEIKPETEKLVRSEETPATPKHAVRTGVPSFGELPYAIQEKIPDFNVSVHMFHVDPTQRRIRINGSMYTEGKSLQQDLALVEITRYGAVFDYQGHLFRFNVR